MADCENNCALAARVDRLETDLAQEKKARHDTHKEFYNRLREVEKTQSVNKEKLDNIEGKIDGMDGKLDALLSKPGKRWEAIVASAISAVVGGAVGFVLAFLGVG